MNSAFGAGFEKTAGIKDWTLKHLRSLVINTIKSPEVDKVLKDKATSITLDTLKNKKVEKALNDKVRQGLFRVMANPETKERVSDFAADVASMGMEKDIRKRLERFLPHTIGAAGLMTAGALVGQEQKLNDKFNAIMHGEEPDPEAAVQHSPAMLGAISLGMIPYLSAKLQREEREHRKVMLPYIESVQKTQARSAYKEAKK